MYKVVACITLLCLACVSGGLIESHHIVQEPVLTKVGSVVHSIPSAVSHQSITRYHNKAVVSPILAPVVKTTVHAAPIVSVVKSVPVVHTYAEAPVVHSLPAVHAASVLHTAPVVHKAIVPSAYAIHH